MPLLGRRYRYFRAGRCLHSGSARRTSGIRYAGVMIIWIQLACTPPAVRVHLEALMALIYSRKSHQAPEVLVLGAQ